MKLKNTIQTLNFSPTSSTEKNSSSSLNWMNQPITESLRIQLMPELIKNSFQQQMMKQAKQDFFLLILLIRTILSPNLLHQSYEQEKRKQVTINPWNSNIHQIDDHENPKIYCKAGNEE